MVVFILFRTFLAVLHGMLDLPQPGIEPMSLHWEHGILTTGPPDKPPIPPPDSLTPRSVPTLNMVEP